MKKLFCLALTICLFGLTQVAQAEVPIQDYFQQKDGCFLLYDLNKKKIVEEYNQPRCQQLIAPDSTFKVPLSLMAFNEKTINQNTEFKWDHKPSKVPDWNKNQTPQTWIQYSVVWVSQQITRQLGMSKVQSYLKKFNYGNQDFSGDPGKNNGLTRAWLSSSLKISAEQQVQFLEKMLFNKLSVSDLATQDTIDNMYLGTTIEGWRLFGKTGSGQSPQGLPEGWFIGFTQRFGQTYIFAVNFTSQKPGSEDVVPGTTARLIAERLLPQYNAL